MKLGAYLGYWIPGQTPADQLAFAVEAERLGYDSVWAAEAYGSDAATVLAWLAAGTNKIKLGSAIFQMPARSAAMTAMTAMTAATIDTISGGRMVLGIGSSGPQVAEGWHGQRFAHQLQRTRAAALPDELIDLITLCGTKDHVRDRLAAFRDAGVGTLTITPMAFTGPERIEQLRAVAELAA